MNASKIFLGLAALALSAGAMAAGKPKIGCRLDYTETRTGPLKVGSLDIVQDRGQQEFQGFAVSYSLHQICAADGGPCSDAYDLFLTIAKEGSQATNLVVVKPGEFSRVYAALQLPSQQSASVSCLNE